MDISTFKIGSLFRFFLQITKTTINILLLLQNFSKWMSIQRDQILYKVSKALEIRFCAIFQRQIQLVNNTYWHQIRANCIPDIFFVFIKIHLKLLQVSPDNLLFLYRVMAELCGIKRNISKSISSTTEINIWVQVFPPPLRSTSEFKFSLHYRNQHLSSNFRPIFIRSIVHDQWKAFMLDLWPIHFRLILNGSF